MVVAEANIISIHPVLWMMAQANASYSWLIWAGVCVRAFTFTYVKWVWTQQLMVTY